jgi:hypothetical protein
MTERNKINFTAIDYKTAVNFLLPRHYSGRKPNIKYSFGYYEQNELKAVCSFGKPANNNLCYGICGKENSNKVYELNRLCVEGEIKIQLSKFVSWCLNWLSKDDLIIVSYADTQMNHNGYIYQATNWIYTGETKARTEKYVSDNKHSRHYSKTQDNSIRKFRSAKHRYVYFATTKRNKKYYKSILNYEIKPYPKGENKNYILGDFLKPTLIYNYDTQTKETQPASRPQIQSAHTSY